MTNVKDKHEPMTKNQRIETWVIIDEDITDGENSISIQDFLDGVWGCYTGNPNDDENPQRTIPFIEFLEILISEYKNKHGE